MQSTRDIALPFVLALLLGCAALPAPAAEGCLDFKWDVSKERALFAGTPALVAAGKGAASAPLIAPDRLYKLRLLAQNRVAFAAGPGKRTPAAGAFAGLAILKVPAAGSYRIAVDLPIWIDVVSSGSLIPAENFEGQHACSAPHKIVEFDLISGRPFVLQLSNAASDSLLLTVTASPPRKF